MHPMQIDTDRAHALIAELGVQAELEAFERDAKVERGQERMQTSDSDPQSWRTVADQAVTVIAERVCPAWDLSATEREMSAAAIAETLDHYFPGSLQGFDAWHPLSKLAGAAAFIVIMRLDLSTGRLQPLHYRKRANGSHGTAAGWPGDIDDRQESLRQNDTEFKTDGE